MCMMFRMSMGQNREVFITVRVEESDYFRREGYDVHTTASISISQALLGGIIRLTGLHEDINLRIPSGTSSHMVMTLSGRGIKHMESFNMYGDHLVHFSFRQKKDTAENTASNKDNASDDKVYSSENDDMKGTIAKITDALNSNETVQKIKKTIFG